MSSKDWYNDSLRNPSREYGNEKEFFNIILKNGKNTGIVEVTRYNIDTDNFDTFNSEVLVNSSQRSSHGTKNISYHKGELRIGDYYSWQDDYLLCDEWENKELPYYDSMNSNIMNRQIRCQVTTRVDTGEVGKYKEPIYNDITVEKYRYAVLRNTKVDTDDGEIINLPNDVSMIKVVYEEFYKIDGVIIISDSRYRIYGIDDSRTKIDANNKIYGVLSILVRTEK